MVNQKNVELIFILSFTAVFSVFILWAIPDESYLLISAYVAAAVSIILGRSTKLGEQKDERAIHIFTLGARNAFIFMLLSIPYLGLFHMIGFVVLDIFTLMVLYFGMLAVSWISIGYYYWK